MVSLTSFRTVAVRGTYSWSGCFDCMLNAYLIILKLNARRVRSRDFHGPQAWK